MESMLKDVEPPRLREFINKCTAAPSRSAVLNNIQRKSGCSAGGTQSLLPYSLDQRDSRKLWSICAQIIGLVRLRRAEQPLQ
jgi:hypothetical protein